MHRSADYVQPPLLSWTPAGRTLVFVLAATSIWCLLADFYHLCPMQAFTLYVLLPATVLLYGIAVFDRRRGDGRLYRAVIIGTVAGLLAAFAYDIFRLPFVFGPALGIDGVVPHLPLFKVFPRFGAMILGQPIEQAQYSTGAQVLGWLYHFSNGMTFGVMYTAAIGDLVRKHWGWAIVMAVGLELAMLFTPYPQVFGITLATTFVVVTLSAHLIFGVALGLATRRMGRRWVVEGEPMAMGAAGS